ncbi:MAG: hypothetical protein JNL18_01940 [Planctomycetaceae bacterium]|nr:hypothetical protein [Planctomycetaceae bacterium]
MKPLTFARGKRLRTVDRITALIGVVSFMLLATASYGAWQVKGQQERSEAILSQSIDSLRAAAELEQHVQELRHDLDVFLWRRDRGATEQGDFTDLRATKSERADIDLWLTRAQAAAHTADETALIDQMRAGLVKFYAQMERIAETPDLGGTRAALAEEAEAILDADVLAPARDFLSADEKLLDASRTEAATQTRRLARWLLGVGSGGALLAMFTGYGLARRISRSLVQLRIPMRDVAGKLSEVAGDVVVSTQLDVDDLGPALERVSTEVTSVVEQLHARHRDMVRADQLAGVGQLAAGLAHEVRNPLMAMKMLIQSARQQGSPGLDGRDLQIIDDEIRRLESLLTEFLDFARPTPLKREMVDLRDLVEKTVDFVERQADARQVTMFCDLPKEPVLLWIDPPRVRQVLLNLLLNGIQAAPLGGNVRVAIDISALEGQQMCRLKISDDGPGIGPRQATRIFEPFYSTKETGLGLGLAVSQRICRSHGGELALERGDYSGAIFVVKLPLPVADEAVTAVRRPSPERPGNER